MVGSVPVCAVNFLNQHMESEADVSAVHRKPGSGQLSEDTGHSWEGCCTWEGTACGHSWNGKQSGTE